MSQTIIIKQNNNKNLKVVYMNKYAMNKGFFIKLFYTIMEVVFNKKKIRICPSLNNKIAMISNKKINIFKTYVKCSIIIFILTIGISVFLSKESIKKNILYEKTIAAQNNVLREKNKEIVLLRKKNKEQKNKLVKYENDDLYKKYEFRSIMDILGEMIYIESTFNNNAQGINTHTKRKNNKYVYSESIDYGLMQLNSRYLQYFVNKYWNFPIDFVWNNPSHSLYLGVSHLYDLYKSTDNIVESIMAYNVGMNGIRYKKKIGSMYLKKLVNLSYYRDFKLKKNINCRHQKLVSLKSYKKLNVRLAKTNNSKLGLIGTKDNYYLPYFDDYFGNKDNTTYISEFNPNISKIKPYYTPSLIMNPIY